MRCKLIFVLIAVILSRTAFGLPEKGILRFRTSTDHIIKVWHGEILYDNKLIFKIKYNDDILYESKSNRLIEDHGSIFLFIAMAGNPNLDRLSAFLITPIKATLVADAILSPIKDYDGDGYLEFGGRDLTEMYNSRDSMYYIPTAYYEIRDGKILPDRALTRRKDIALNGLYLSPEKQLDHNGNCCKVVRIPWGRHNTRYQPAGSKFNIKSFMPSDTISVFATSYVLIDKDDITDAVHDFQGTWHFFSKGRTYTPTTAERKVKLAQVVKIDGSILLLSWMPKGYYAKRTSKTTPWGMDKLKYKE